MLAERRRARADLVRLARKGLGVEAFVHRAGAVVERVVPADGSCVLVLDPATLLPTDEVVVDAALPAEVLPRMTEIELTEADVNKFVALAPAPAPAASLSAATAGDLDRSRRHRELRGPSGFGDELRVALRDDEATWGALTLLRERGAPDFTAAEVGLVGDLSGLLAEGIRHGLAADAVDATGRAAPGSSAPDAADTGIARADGHSRADRPRPSGPGLVVLAPDGVIELCDREAERWLDELGGDPAHPLPVSVRAAAHRARRSEPGGLTRARVRTGSGVWVSVRGSRLGDGPEARVAVHLTPAPPPELAPLLVALYGFTERERQVTELVARGGSTAQVAARLGISAYTVQDHLKSIFEKSGTSTRGDLVARLFVDLRAGSLTIPPPATRPSI